MIRLGKTICGHRPSPDLARRCAICSGGLFIGPTPPTFAVQQVVGYLRYTGWAVNVVARAETEKQGVPGRDSKPILVAETDDGILAVSFLTFDSKWVPYAVIEDLVVDSGQRNTGIGKAVMDWIASEAGARDIHRLMLESGLP